MKFLQAAIKVKDPNHDDVWYLFTGRRYLEIFPTIWEAGLGEAYKQNHIDGFTIIDEYGKTKFVDRAQATNIAKVMGIDMIAPNTLTSEDLW